MGKSISKLIQRVCSCSVRCYAKTAPKYVQRKVGKQSWEMYPFVGYIENCEQLQHWKKVFPQFALTDIRIAKLHKVFKEIDTSGDGTLSCDEFYSYFGFSFQTPLTRRYFNAMDADGSGELDFGEFAVAAWNICANLDETGMIMFAFDIYDTIPPHGQIAGFQAFEMLLHAYNGVKHMNNLTEGCIQKLRQWEGTIGKHAFLNFVMANRSVFFPVFSIQAQMKKRILGGVFWNDVIQDLKKMVKPQNRVSNAGDTNSTFMSTGHICRVMGIPWKKICERLEPVMDFRRKAVLLKHGFIKSTDDTSLAKYDKVLRNKKIKKKKKKKKQSVKQITRRINPEMDDIDDEKMTNNSKPTWRTSAVKYKQGRQDSSPMARRTIQPKSKKKNKK